jgi:transcriptional regulator with XRE-family HTH domain
MPPGVRSGLLTYYTRCKSVCMTLDEYLRSPANTASKLAEDAGTTGATITRILYGDAQPSAEMVRAIVEATGGQVTAHDLIFGQPREKKGEAA